MQLTGCDYGNDMRNAMYVEQIVLTWVDLLFIPHIVPNTANNWND